MSLLADLVAEHRAYVRASLTRLGVVPDALDDAEQEVFVVLVRRNDEFDPAFTHRRWLWGISRRVALAFRRRARRHDARWQPLTERSERPPVEDRLDAAFALRGLDPHERDVWLARVEGRSAAEIAAAMEMPVTTVQWRLRTAGKRVRSAIGSLGRQCSGVVLGWLRPLRAYALTVGSVAALSGAMLELPAQGDANPAVTVPAGASGLGGPTGASRSSARAVVAPCRAPTAAPAPRPIVIVGPPVVSPPVRTSDPPTRRRRNPNAKPTADATDATPDGKVRLLAPHVLRLPPGHTVGGRAH